MEKISIKNIQNNILERYKKHGRKLPWRQTKDPYAIHISEVMLQQTQVDRVIPYFLQWMKDYPEYKTLAKTSKSDLLKHWSGLGFNSRVLRLRETAKLVEGQKSKVKSLPSPLTPLLQRGESLAQVRSELMKLPGIGPYTSAAIMAFAWNKEVPVIDTNIRRVLIFLFKLDEKITAGELEKFAEKIIPKGNSRDWHNALIDYGALELTARKTKIKPLSKQSKFEGSDRQVRGRILRQLITNNSQLTVKKIKEEFPRKDMKNIIAGMVKEGLIVMKKGVITIAE